MRQFILTIGGLSTVIAAWLVFNQGLRRRSPVPVSRAAEQLQQAWADHHTEA